MSTACPACAGLPEVGLDDLEVIGGSENPFNPPWGELRRCRACAAYWLYTNDHDNEIGYQASGVSIERISTEKARSVAEAAIPVARSLRDHFAAKTDAYSIGCAEDYDRALVRLEQELARLT